MGCTASKVAPSRLRRPRLSVFSAWPLRWTPPRLAPPGREIPRSAGAARAAQSAAGRSAASAGGFPSASSNSRPSRGCAFSKRRNGSRRVERAGILRRHREREELRQVIRGRLDQRPAGEALAAPVSGPRRPAAPSASVPTTSAGPGGDRPDPATYARAARASARRSRRDRADAKAGDAGDGSLLRVEDGELEQMSIAIEHLHAVRRLAIGENDLLAGRATRRARSASAPARRTGDDEEIVVGPLVWWRIARHRAQRDPGRERVRLRRAAGAAVR